MRNVYFDNNATSCVAPEVLDEMLPFLRDLWGNPSSMHYFGGQVKRYVERAREQVAALLHCDPSEVLFTSGGTESDNTAVRGTAEAWGPRLRIITSRVEHPAVLGPCRHLRDQGFGVTELSVNAAGQLDLEQVRRAVHGGNVLVTVMWANNETGVIFPLEQIAALVREAGGVLHTDAVQAVGKVAIDLQRLPVDLLSLSGHKLHAPKGVGALYIRKGTKLNTFMLGGHQENSRRGGTENVPGIVGLGKACELAAQHLPDEQTRVARLRDKLEAGILERCPDTQVNGDRVNRLPNTTNISFRFVEGEAILYHMSDVGIAASSGSACTSGSLEPSHVIRAMGVPFTAAHGSTRFSLSRYNTEEEVDYALEQLPPIINRLRALSPFVT